MAARCLPRRRRARPARAPLPLVIGAARSTLASPSSGGFVQAAVDAYARTGHRPTWLSEELLAVLEARGRLVGLVYLLHFDRPIGDTSNPRGFAAHYTGWTLDLSARLAAHAAGRGARLMEVVGEAGIGWQLARVWPGTRTRERSLKGSGGAARRCPICQLTRLGLAPARPADLFVFEVGARAAACTAPPSELRRPSSAGEGRMTSIRPTPEGGEPMPASQTWLRTSQAAARLHVTAKTVTRWASEGRLEHRRTLGGHRRFDPALIDALVEALTYRL